jgi:hypothetical protein
MPRCEVFWGSHGCNLEKGHEGFHRCCCTDPEEGEVIDPVTRTYVGGEMDGVLNVGTWPYYGPETKFYGAHVRENEFGLMKEIAKATGLI